MPFSSAYCSPLPPPNSTIQRFDARYFTLDFPLTAIATVVAETEGEMDVNCEFRSNRDLVGLLWNTNDRYGHPMLQYIEDRNYAGCRLAFTANPPDRYNFTVTLATTEGAQVYRMYPYKAEGGTVVPDVVSPEFNGGGPGLSFAVADLFPAGLSITPGHDIFVLDFNNLSRGFNYDLGPIVATQVRQLFFSLTPAEYGLGAATVANAGVLTTPTSNANEVRVVSTEDLTSMRLLNVNPNFRFTRGDTIQMALGVPVTPRVGGKSTIYYDIDTQTIDLTVLEWSGDGTTERFVKLPGDGLKGVAFQGGKVIATRLQKDTPLGNVTLAFRVRNMSVTGERTTLPRRFYPQPVHLMEITSGYDDTYNITPWRQIDNAFNLGYRGMFTMYMGMSHYFKAFSSGGFRAFNNTVVKDAAEPLNVPTEEWCKSLFANAHARGYTFIWSTSYEILNSYCPDEWAQKDYQQKNGLSGWVPPSAFVIPAYVSGNSPIDYLARVIKHGLRLMSENGATELRFQIGEPWWWDGSYSNGAPALYDPYTRNLYTTETGQPVPTPFIQDYRETDLTIHMPYLIWLGAKLGASTNYIRDNVKAAYPGALATLLFFSPQIFAGLGQTSPGLPGQGETSGLLSIINFPTEQWKYPNYDFMQIEDYDWIIKSELVKLPLTRQAALEMLEYPIEVVQYFVGFVLLKKETWVWPNINIATREAKLAGLTHIAIWAYPQVIRDGILYDDSIIETDAARQPDVPSRRQLNNPALAANVVRPIFFAQIGSDIFMNSGDRNIEYDGRTWLAVGRFGKLSAITEGIFKTESGWTMALSGVPVDQVHAVSAAFRNDNVTLLIGLVGPDLQLLEVPRVVAQGRIFDNNVAVEERSATIQLNVRSRLASWRQTKSARYTNEDQQRRHPNDEGFKFVAALPYTKLLWGDQNA